MRLLIRVAVSLCLLLLVLPVAGLAAVANFSWTQTDAATGSGTLTGNINSTPVGGPGVLPFRGVLPSPTVTQNDTNTGFTVPGTAVGFITTADGALSGIDNGVHVGFSGTVVMTATAGPDSFTIDVPLVLGSGDPWSYSYTVFDNPAENDVTGSPRFAGWLGNNGNGHRHTDGTRTFAGGQDNHTASASFGLGSNAGGDNVGIAAGIRDGSFNGPVFVDDLTFGGELFADPATLTKNGVGISSPDPFTPFDIVLDIGPEGQRVQSGHIGVPDPADPSTPNANQNGPEPSGVPVSTGTGLFFLSISDTNQAGGDDGRIDWRDRGNSSNGGADLVMLAEDFIKNNGGIIRLTLEDLPAGTYDVTSYHVDPDFDQSEAIKVFVDAGGGFVDMLVEGDASHNNGGVNGLTTADILDSAASFSFVSDGLSPIHIVFDGNLASDTEVPLSGLRLQFTPNVIPEPAALLIWSLLAGLGFGLGWRRRQR